MSSSKIQIRLATNQDLSILESSFNSHFLQDEPLNIYLKDHKSSKTEILPNFSLTLIAEIVDDAEQDDVKFAGFLICEICEKARKKDKETGNTNNRAEYEIFRILKEIDKRFDVFQMYNVQKVLDFVVLSVVPEFRGKSIGLKLCEKAFEVAKAKECELVYMDCTSLFSAIIADKLGMELIGEISYEGFQKECGETLYNVNEKHTHIRRYVKMLKK